MHYDGKLRATSRTSLTVEEMNAGPTNNMKGMPQGTKVPTYPKGNKGKGVQEKGASQAMSLNKDEADHYLKSGELSFPSSSNLYDYLSRDEGSNEEGDLDQGYDEVGKPKDYRVDYSAKRY